MLGPNIFYKLGFVCQDNFFLIIPFFKDMFFFKDILGKMEF